MKMAVLTSLNLIGPFFPRRWPTVVFQFSLRNERVIFHEQEGVNTCCHAVATPRF